MTEISSPADARQERIYELFSGATQEASDAMSRWTGGEVTLSLNEVQEISLDEIFEQLDVCEDLLTMVVLSIDEEIGGELILTFDELNGRRLAATLAGREVDLESPWTPLEKSALCETGNILGCAYLNALAQAVGVDLIPSPPHFIQDYGASVLQQALLTQAMMTDEIMIARTGFARGDEQLDWSVYFIPTLAMRDALEQTLSSRNGQAKV